jgi:hypothetical protein
MSDDISSRLAAIEDKVDRILAAMESISGNVEPAISALSSHPMFKLLVK